MSWRNPVQRSCALAIHYSTTACRFVCDWHITRNVSLNLLGGVAVAGEIRLEDRNGNRPSRDDYDPAPYVGVRLLGGI
jgi:hypothetical protein